VEVVGLWRYPVKSLQGEALESASFVTGGVSGDREWGIRDERTGRILTARRRPELLEAAATYAGGRPAVTLPDGRTTIGPGPETDALLSEWLGSPVSLVPSADRDGGRAEYFADATDDASEAIRWTMPADRFVDAMPLLVLTTASLRTASALHPEGDWDLRRFRPNIVVETDDGFVEGAWQGQLLTVGPVRMQVSITVPRCVMTTLPQGDLPADRDVLRTIARTNSVDVLQTGTPYPCVGVYADVLAEGEIRRGDPVRLIG